MTTAIVVNRDTRAQLADCLGRMAPLDGRLAVIVVDNASGDGSPEMIRERFPQHRLIALDEAIGYGAANNLGAAAAGDGPLLLLNSDAWIEAADLEALEQLLRSQPDVGLVAPRLRYPDGRPQFSWSPDASVFGEAIQKLRNPFEGRRWNHELLPRLLRRLFGPGWYTTACALVRAEAFHAVSGFDETYPLYFEDVDLCLRLRQAGWRLAEAGRAVATHVKGGTRHPQRVRLYREGRLRFYRKHRPGWEQAIVGWHARR